MTCEGQGCDRLIWRHRGGPPEGYWRHAGHGLCSRCADRVRHGRSRHNKTWGDLAEDYVILRGEGLALPFIAERMGMEVRRLREMLRRNADDPRAALPAAARRPGPSRGARARRWASYADRYADLVERGLSLREIAAALDMKVATLERAVRRHRAPKPAAPSVPSADHRWRENAA